MPLNPTGWTATADSNETSFGPGEALLAYWDMEHGWVSGSGAFPHHLIVDMQSAQTFGNIYFTTTFDWASNGFAAIGWQDYEVYVSSDGSTWGSAIASGTLASPQGQFLIPFTTQTKRYIKLVAVSASAATPPGGGSYSNRAAVLNFFVDVHPGEDLGAPTGSPGATAGTRVIFLTSGTSWVGVETNGDDILVECIGGGGNGSQSTPATNVGAGGGGGAYAKKTVPYTSGASVTGIQIGSALDTKWDGSVVIAKKGANASGATGGAGGAAASCTPSTGAFSGGNGGTSAFSLNGGAGAGGAAGPGGAGKNGGAGGNSNGGAGGGGAGGGSSTAGVANGPAGNTGSAGGLAQDGTAGGTGTIDGSPSSPGGAGSHGSGGGGSGSSSTASSTGTGGAGGAGIEWTTKGAGGGGAGSGGRNGGAAATTGTGGAGGLYGGGGGGAGWTSGTFGAAGTGATGLIVITYTPPDTLGPEGIASEEAFGTPTITAAAAQISPSGIASEEAFGSPTLSVISSASVQPSGIASDEAFGSPTIVPGETFVSPSSIASGETFGTPSILQSSQPRFLLAGVDRTAYLHHETDYSWNLMKGSRGSCSIPFYVEPGDTYTPLPGDLIEIFDPGDTRVWAGTIEQVFIRWLGDRGDHIFVVTGVTLESLFDAAFVDKTVFDGVSGAVAFEDLFDAVDQDIVTLGDVDDDEIIEALEVTRAADGFSSIALRSDRIWFVDPADLTLNLIAPLSRPAPWIMGSGPSDIVWESIQWRQSRADFRDTQVIQSPDGSSQTVIAVAGNASLGRRSARLTFTTSNTGPGAIQEATAVLRRFSTLPSQLVVTTDRPGISIGMLLEIDVDFPLESAGVLNGFWQVVEVEARMLTGMDKVDPVLRRLPTDLSLGHFRYTLRLVNSLALAIFKGDGLTTVFTLPVTPGSVSFIRVSPNPELYTATSLGDEVTITPAMPPGSYGLVGYEGEATPDAGSWLETWKGMSPIAASAGPAGSSGGGSAQKFIAPLLLRRLTVDNDIADHAIVYNSGTGTRVLAVLRKILTDDLIVRINLNGNELMTVTIDNGTAVDDVLEFPMSARAFTVTIASPGVVTVAGASLGDGNPVVLHTTGALPTGLLEDTNYWVVNSAGSSFELAATPGGSSIDTTGTQSGNHWLTSSAIPAPDFTDKDVLTADILASDEQSDRNGVAALGVEWA